MKDEMTNYVAKGFIYGQKKKKNIFTTSDFGIDTLCSNYSLHMPHLAFGYGLIQHNCSLVGCAEYIGRSIIDSTSSRKPGSSFWIL